jgi:hypothetical protein
LQLPIGTRNTMAGPTRELRATLVQADALEWQSVAPFDAVYEQDLPVRIAS